MMANPLTATNKLIPWLLAGHRCGMSLWLTHWPSPTLLSLPVPAVQQSMLRLGSHPNTPLCHPPTSSNLWLRRLLALWTLVAFHFWSRRGPCGARGRCRI